MNDLEKTLENHSEIRYTTEELNKWVNSLSERKKNLVLDTLLDAKKRGMDVHKIACKLYEKAQEIDENNKQPWYVSVSNAMIGWTLGGIINGNKKL